MTAALARSLVGSLAPLRATLEAEGRDNVDVSTT